MHYALLCSLLAFSIWSVFVDIWPTIEIRWNFSFWARAKYRILQNEVEWNRSKYSKWCNESMFWCLLSFFLKSTPLPSRFKTLEYFTSSFENISSIFPKKPNAKTYPFIYLLYVIRFYVINKIFQLNTLNFIGYCDNTRRAPFRISCLLTSHHSKLN